MHHFLATMDNDKKMSDLDEAFGMLLSVWGGYFDDDPVNFFEASRPLLDIFNSRYREAEKGIM